jgi:hypothetical protein
MRVVNGWLADGGWACVVRSADNGIAPAANSAANAKRLKDDLFMCSLLFRVFALTSMAHQPGNVNTPFGLLLTILGGHLYEQAEAMGCSALSSSAAKCLARPFAPLLGTGGV